MRFHSPKPPRERKEDKKGYHGLHRAISRSLRRKSSRLTMAPLIGELLDRLENVTVHAVRIKGEPSIDLVEEIGANLSRRTAVRESAGANTFVHATYLKPLRNRFDALELLFFLRLLDRESLLVKVRVLLNRIERRLGPWNDLLTEVRRKHTTETR